MDKLLKYIGISQIFYGLLIVEIIFFSWLNFDNKIMGGILPLYESFADLFRAKLGLIQNNSNNITTFPMWGYGFVFLITKNKLLIFIFQQILSIYTIFFTEKTLIQGKYNSKTVGYFRFFILIGLSWHIFQSVLWPYSIAANLMVIALMLLYRFFLTKKALTIIMSALLIGITLNFRSDYFYFIIGFTLILLFFDFIKKERHFLFILLWFSIVMLAIVPWGIYSYQKTGHFSTTSTNGGHVLFVGLGQLPNNSWIITPQDSDPLMHQLLREQQGDKYVGSLNYDANQILMQEWKKRVIENPGEFLKKCFYVQSLYFLEPFTHGQLYANFTTTENWNNKKYIIKQDVLELRFGNVMSQFFNSGYLWIILIVAITAIIINLLFWFYLIKRLFKIFKILINSKLFIIAISVIGYQVLLQTVGYYMSYYNTNAFLFYIILLSVFIGEFKKEKVIK